MTETTCGSGAKRHSWGTWRTAADSFGLLLPHTDGKYYRYKRECNLMGCSAVQYAEYVAPVGNVREEARDGI